MKEFKSPRKYQGGWIEAAIVAGTMLLGAIEGREEKKAQEKSVRDQGLEGRKSDLYSRQLDEWQKGRDLFRHRQGLSNWAGPWGNKWKTLQGYKPTYVPQDPGEAPKPLK